MLFSGISIMVVMPPAAAARVADENPSPIGTARLVDVHVCIDKPRHNDGAGGFLDWNAVWHIIKFADGDDNAAAYVDEVELLPGS